MLVAKFADHLPLYRQEAIFGRAGVAIPRSTLGAWVGIGRNNWLFAGSLRAGKRGAAIMSLIQSAKLNGHDPFAYLKDVLTRLPTQRATRSMNCCRIAGSLKLSLHH